MKVLHINTSREVDAADLDLRTKKGNEEQVLRAVRLNGGFSIFWVTDTQKRAQAADRLIEQGKIKRLPDSYPWCAYKEVK